MGTLRTTPALHRLLRRTMEGLLRLDRAAVKREARLDGRWLLRTSDESLSAADLAAAYRQLYQVEHGWRDVKGALALRPVFHHREGRVARHSQTTAGQRRIFAALELPEPPLFSDFEVGATEG